MPAKVEIGDLVFATQPLSTLGSVELTVEGKDITTNKATLTYEIDEERTDKRLIQILNELTIKIVENNDDNKEISNLKGIEFFTNIWLLECYYNNLTTIDLSHNKNLSYINCHHNQLNELDVSGLPLLETFYCGHNALPSIDVSKNEKLEDFDCQDNHLDTLDVSQNKELVKLSCGTNNLTELDVRENKKLKELSCYESKLSNLDLRNQTELEVLKCWKNPLSVLDVSANTKLKTLFVSNTNLTSLDAKNHTALATFGGKNCSYNIAVEGDGKFDLTTLPGKFDASKATATGNGTINGNILTVNPNSKTFYYDYDIGQNQKNECRTECALA